MGEKEGEPPMGTDKTDYTDGREEKLRMTRMNVEEGEEREPPTILKRMEWK